MANVFPSTILNKLASTKILLVGTGGVGCELLKGLVQSGFKTIEVVDLDTIDVSNLNRQFLFRKIHVGKSKAEVARDSIMNHFKGDNKPSIKAHVRSIIDPDLNGSWFKQFDIVVNALDNVGARSHVNRMCLANGVPLVESGTRGLIGQAELILKGVTECYECKPKNKDKVYPSCTIRNTPSEPIHCIVWAKHLYCQLFGEKDETGEAEVSPAIGLDKIKNGGDAGDDKTDSLTTRKWAELCDYNPEKLFKKLFKDDIEYLLQLDALWTSRTPPKPLLLDRIICESENSRKEEQVALADSRLWSLKECYDNFCRSVKNLKKRLFAERESGGFLSWDKDDDDDMDFVTACSNLRSIAFNIERKNRFDVKSMAGNIVPAVATSNAVVASAVVLLVVQYLTGKLEDCRTFYLRSESNHYGQIFTRESALLKPNPSCLICSTNPQAALILDVNTLTLEQLKDDVLKKTLHLIEPEVMIKESCSVIFSCDEDYSREYLNRPLKEFGIRDGTVLFVDDFLQTCKFYIQISQRTVAEGEEVLPFELTMNSAITTTPEVNGSVNEEMDGTEMVIPLTEDNVVTSTKRKHDEGDIPVEKRIKI